MSVDLSYRLHPGGISEGEFNALLPAARATVDFLVGRNEVTDGERYREAVWAAMGALSEAHAGGSMSIGSFSVSGGDSRSRSDAARDAAYRVLAATGMVYAGVL